MDQVGLEHAPEGGHGHGIGGDGDGSGRDDELGEALTEHEYEGEVLILPA